MKELIYFDNAATTPIRPEVYEEIKPYIEEHFGNPSSIYSIARDSKKAIDKARQQVADALNAQPAEIYFTGCGSESDNWVLKGVSSALKNKGNHIITTCIEHHAILHTCEYLEKNGFEVTYLPVDEYGKISLDDLKAAIRPETILVSVMFANNEIGTVEPIKEIGAICHEKGIYFHTDAVQAFGHIKIDVQDMNIDFLSISGHKIGAPKGIGALYIRKGCKIDNLIHGGQQERGRRAGTENVIGIVALGKAAEMAMAEIDEVTAKLTYLRDKLINSLLSKIDYARLNGHPVDRLPGNVNISFEFIEGESMLLLLDNYGICASSGSACTSGSLDPSHVLLAIGLPHEKAHGSLRISLGYQNTEEQVDKLIEVLPPIVQRLRDMSPLYEEIKNKNK
ncbi:cysteine desulfurase NifS [Anaerotignum sp. MSJ-24]|uniref:cysteine desulfurase NifS n=1 Tax=Anaerotignum sp. MSJ-24 TaxID=2841521 RepID=UPI001C1114E6|nr:cysteine desulfurase NifS [Anaerotignum sp. MSJ-24]MBU5463838.1 cysteine desulfurase NifS [Anaerotignum sp. MSJ-24]